MSGLRGICILFVWFAVVSTLYASEVPVRVANAACQEQLSIEPLLRQRSHQLKVEQFAWLTSTADALRSESSAGNRRAVDMARALVYERVGGAELLAADQKISQLLGVSAAEIARAELGGDISNALRAITGLKRKLRPLPKWLHRAADNRVFSAVAWTASYVPRFNVYWRYQSIGKLLGKVRQRLEKGLTENRADRTKIDELADEVGREVGDVWDRAALLMALSELLNADGEPRDLADSKLRRGLSQSAMDLAELAFVLDNTRLGLEAVEDFYEDLERAGNRALQVALPALGVVAAEMVFAAKGLLQARDLQATRQAVGIAMVISSQMTQRLSEVVQELDETPMISREQLREVLRARAETTFPWAGRLESSLVPDEPTQQRGLP